MRISLTTHAMKMIRVFATRVKAIYGQRVKLSLLKKGADDAEYF
jgi:hypothetical protein